MNRCLISFAAKQFVWLIILAAAIFSAGTAYAVPPPLNPGETQYNPALNPPFPFFTPPYTAGPLPAIYSVFLISHDFPYNYNGTKDNSFSGFVRSAVWQDPVTRELAFTYVLNNLTPPFPPNPPLTDIVRATINDPTNPWAPFQILAAGSDPNSGGHSTPINGFFGGWNNGVPFDIVRSATDFGVAIEFNPLNSGTQLNSTPNDQSALIWFATDATTFNVTKVGFSDNGHVGTGQAFAPNVVQIPLFICPEPSALVLAILGCCGYGFAIRWVRTTGHR
jgi:hypothetical protein